MKHLFIVNPAAGKGKGLLYIKAIQMLFGGKSDYHIEVTKEKGDATNIARRYTQNGCYIVYAVGGDGTINEVVNGMVGSDSVLAIVPAGSGNDFIRSIYPKIKREELLNRLLNGKQEVVDLVKINDKYFLNVASVGIDAEIVYNATAFKKLKYIKGEFAYLISIVKTLLKHSTTKVRVSIDGEEKWDKEILLLAVANGRFYGGGIQVAPSAEVDDAKANIYLVRKLNLAQIFPLALKLAKAKHEDDKEVHLYKAKKIEIESQDLFKVNIDGEIVQTNKVKMEVIPQAIQVIIPA